MLLIIKIQLDRIVIEVNLVNQSVKTILELLFKPAAFAYEDHSGLPIEK